MLNFFLYFESVFADDGDFPEGFLDMLNSLTSKARVVFMLG